MGEWEMEEIYEDGCDAYYYQLNDIDNCLHAGRLSIVWMAGWIDEKEKEEQAGEGI